jgi:hypothetical protein
MLRDNACHNSTSAAPLKTATASAHRHSETSGVTRRFSRRARTSLRRGEYWRHSSHIGHRRRGARRFPRLPNTTDNSRHRRAGPGGASIVLAFVEDSRSVVLAVAVVVVVVGSSVVVSSVSVVCCMVGFRKRPHPELARALPPPADTAESACGRARCNRVGVFSVVRAANRAFHRRYSSG